MVADGFVPHPAEQAQRYRELGLWSAAPIGELPHAWARRDPAHTALVNGAVRLTYQQLADNVDVLADRLAALGLQRGDSAIMQLPNGHAFVVLLLACLKVGVQPVPMLPAHRDHELGRVAEHLQAAAIVVPAPREPENQDSHPVHAARRAASAARTGLLIYIDDTDPDGAMTLRPETLEHPRMPFAGSRPVRRTPPAASDIALFLLSGGTTGLPKIIARTHEDYAYTARASAELCGLGPDTVTLCALPIAHTFALACPGVLGTLMRGGTVVTLPSPRPDLVFETIDRERVTHTAAVPAVVRQWIAARAHGGWSLRSLSMLQVGGACLAPETARLIPQVLGCALQQVYGMSEGLLNFTRLEDSPEIIFATQGRPLSPHDEIRIVDERGDPVADGESGELLARGPTTIAGYFRAPEHNERRFAPGGWYRTGDLVRRHPSGNLIVEGRRSGMINRAGEKILAEEIEELLCRVPGIAGAAVLPEADRDLGERVHAYILAAPGATPTLQNVREALRHMGVAEYKLPEIVDLIPELPRTAVGKLDRRALQATDRRRAENVEVP